MSSGKRLVSLILESGDRFDKINVEDGDWSLATFLDGALKALEVGPCACARLWVARCRYHEGKCMAIYGTAWDVI